MTGCNRCGKRISDPRVIPVSGTGYAVPVCSACYDYLMQEEIAYERFSLLVRAKRKRSREGK